MTQFGSTIEVYNQPADLRTARTFSDPPFNLVEVNLQDNAVRAGELSLGAVSANLRTLANGSYTAAIRPHHLSLTRTDQHQVALPAQVGTSEITGSETFIHLNVLDNRWVVLTHGVHRVDTGDTLEVYLDPDSLYLFAADETLARVPSIALEGR